VKIFRAGRIRDRVLLGERAQATSEYVLMLAVVVSLALVVLKKGLQPLFQQLQTTLFRRLEQGTFPAGEGMRRNPLIRGR
jgi:hypothetical protein